MPLLIAPVFNSIATKPLRLELPNSYYLVAGAKKPYELASKYLRDEMDENKRLFDKRVDPMSLFLVADYPEMRVKNDQDWIDEIEGKLNMSVLDGVCSIPYVITIQSNMYGINYLKRSLDGAQFIFDSEAQSIFESLLGKKLPSLAFRRYSLSHEKKSPEDQLLDLWIALESLFAPDGKKGEITYKLRLRMAYYFGTTFEEREKIAEFIKKSYNQRSEIVHSGKVYGQKISNEVNLLRMMARSAILNTAMEGITIQELRVRLDHLIMAGEDYVKRYSPRRFERITVNA